MLWGLPSGSDPAWTAAVSTPGTTSLLSFNEPDLTYGGSSNILPAAAACAAATEAARAAYVEAVTPA